MNISEIYHRIVLISPRVEVFLRKIYWKNVSVLNKYKPKRGVVVKDKTTKKTDFNQVLEYLKTKGVGKGSLLVVHSSYDALVGTGLSPSQIIDALLGLIGEQGTLVMPVIRHFKEDPLPNDMLQKNMDEIVCVYDVKKTPIISGLLPLVLMKKKGSVTSRFPLNPITAYGPLANAMTQNNIEGEDLSPHGKNSCWQFCVDHNAVVVGLGLNSGFLTISHVFEETMSDWPIRDWYRKRVFKIIDGDFEIIKTIIERKPKWGLIHFAEINNRNDLVKNDILMQMENEDIKTCIIDSKKLIEFYKEKNMERTGYPYYVKKQDLK